MIRCCASLRTGQSAAAKLLGLSYKAFLYRLGKLDS
jgi:hypothetical protein